MDDQRAAGVGEATGANRDARPAAESEDESGPAIVTRMTAHLRLVRIGNVAAVLAAVACLVALVVFPPEASSDSWAPGGALAAAVLLLVVCTGQHALWLRAFTIWRGSAEAEPVEGGPVDAEPVESEPVDAEQDDLDRASRTSYRLHVASYPILLLGLYLCIEASALGGFSGAAGFALGIAALLLIIAQVTCAVQFLRTGGPPGTVPTHARNLLARVRSLR